MADEPKKETVRIVLPPRRDGQPLASNPRETAMINLPPKPVPKPPAPAAPGAAPAPSVPPPAGIKPPARRRFLRLPPPRQHPPQRLPFCPNLRLSRLRPLPSRRPCLRPRPLLAHPSRQSFRPPRPSLRAASRLRQWLRSLREAWLYRPPLRLAQSSRLHLRQHPLPWHPPRLRLHPFPASLLLQLRLQRSLLPR